MTGLENDFVMLAALRLASGLEGSLTRELLLVAQDAKLLILIGSCQFCPDLFVPITAIPSLRMPRPTSTSGVGVVGRPAVDLCNTDRPLVRLEDSLDAIVPC